MHHLSLIFLLTLSRTVKCLVDGDLRFNGRGSSTTQGRVEIYKNGTWGTVCSRHFVRAEAQVVCRQLGVPEQYIASSQAILDGRFGAGTGPILIDDIKCHGYERRLLNCMFSYWANNCGHSDDVGVICSARPTTTPVASVPPPIVTTPQHTTSPPGLVKDYGVCINQNMPVRLVRPPNLHGGGVVQVFVNGQWGGISDDCFNRAAAQVICRMLCYDPRKAVPGLHDFDMSGIPEPVVLTNVTCIGLENSILSCAHTISSTTTCELAKVTCVDMTTVMPTIDPPDLNCDNSLITGNFTSSWAAFVPHSQISLVWHHGGVCNVKKVDQTSYITLSIPFDQCGTQYTWNTSHIMYENAVLYVPAPTGIITRIRTYMIYLTCVLPRNYVVERPVIPISGSLEEIATANYTIYMFFYTDNFITQVTQYPLQIAVGNWLHVSISMVGHYENIKLVVPNCYATPSTDRNHPTRYPLFTDKCKDDDTVTFFCLSDLEFGFRYQTFKFVQYNEVHIHCEAYVCPKADRSQACDCLCHRNTQGPIGKRKKRDTKRDWIHVKSNVILMYDPADEQGKPGYMGPTLPSYTNNFTTQFHETPRSATPTPVPGNSISAVEVVGKNDTSSEQKEDLESNNGNTASESTGPRHSSAPLQDKDSEGKNSTVPSAEGKTTTTKYNPENGPVAVESNVDSGSEVSNAEEKVTTVKPNIVNPPVAVGSTENSGSVVKEAGVGTASPNLSVEISNEARDTTTHQIGDVLSATSGNLSAVDVGTNATSERFVFSSAPGFCISIFGFFLGLITSCFSQLLF